MCLCVEGLANLDYPQIMKLTEQQLKIIIRDAGFPSEKVDAVTTIINNGIELFREYKKSFYYSHTGKKIKKPRPTHATKIGRYDQKSARTILISALCRAWMKGFDEKPKLNHRNNDDTAFFGFAMQIMAREGIRNIHAHLEEYWSIRKKTAEKDLNSEK
jgi:hypothetical protein